MILDRFTHKFSLLKEISHKVRGPTHSENACVCMFCMFLERITHSIRAYFEPRRLYFIRHYINDHAPIPRTILSRCTHALRVVYRACALRTQARFVTEREKAGIWKPN